MTRNILLERSRNALAVGTAVAFLSVATPRRGQAEDYLESKVMYYLEDGDRIKVFSPVISYQAELSSTLSIKIDGIYNSISGATPTGAPPGSDGSASGSAGRNALTLKPGASPAAYPHYSGASPSPAPAPTPAPDPTPVYVPDPTPSPSSSAPAPSPEPAEEEVPASGKVPTSTFDDERYAGNVEVTKRINNHAVSGLLSYSTESDYDSLGLAVRDAVDFNQKNTTLLFGGAYTHDRVDPANGTPSGDKDLVDVMAGLTQVLDPRTLFTVNLTLGLADGLLSDPYKVVELNGDLVAESRPETKDKQIVMATLAHYFPSVAGSAEGSYRFYNDSFGIQAHTVQLAWYQKLGPNWIVRPLVRYYDQGAADFYGVRFSGSPDHYSSDYRVSALTALGYGLKVAWKPNARIQLDASVERYEQSGKDSETPEDVYPSATYVILGARLWL